MSYLFLFIIYGCGPLIQIFIPPSNRGSTLNLIRLAKRFGRRRSWKMVHRRRTTTDNVQRQQQQSDDGRTTDNVYTFSSLCEPNGELITNCLYSYTFVRFVASCWISRTGLVIADQGLKVFQGFLVLPPHRTMNDATARSERAHQFEFHELSV